jgi:hypothetical protein
MKKIITILICIIFSLCAKNANAYGNIKGVSLGEFSFGCDYYLIEDSTGSYTLAEWYGGATTYAGDIIYGELHSYGFKDLYDITRDRTTRAWLDDWLLSQDSASEKLIDKCGWDRNIFNYFSLGGSAYGTGYGTGGTTNYTTTCPANASLVGTGCVCNDGYLASGSACITYNQACQNQYGNNATGDKNNCWCNTGYQWNAAKTACVAQLPSCPANSSYVSGTCVCNEGYTTASTGGCITYTLNCAAKYGYAHGDKNGCYCDAGYEMDATKNLCVPVLTCSANSTKSNGQCYCWEGYAYSEKQKACITVKDLCIEKYGQNISRGETKENNTKLQCYCKEGYVFNSNGDTCVKTSDTSEQVDKSTKEFANIQQETGENKSYPTVKQNEEKLREPIISWSKIFSPVKKLWNQLFKR